MSTPLAPLTPRPLTPSDRPLYLSLCHAFYHSPAVLHPVPDSHFEACFDALMAGNPFAEGLILEWNGTPVGYALLAITYSQEAGGKAIWIEELSVLPEYRGRGFATQFFAWLMENRPAARYRLETEPENEGAKRLYSRIGFERLEYESMILDR